MQERRLWELIWAGMGGCIYESWIWRRLLLEGRAAG